MNKKEIKEQLRQIGTAANNLAGAISSLIVRLSCDIMLDDEVEKAERESGHPMARVMHEPTFDRGGNVAIPKMKPVTLAFQNNDDTHHCRQDALEENTPTSLKELLGLQVIGIGKGKCDGCPVRAAYCRKVELVGGVYVCLAVPHQGQPVISFDDEEQDESLGDIMAEIKEKAEDFMDYLDSVVRTGDDEKV